MNNKIVRSHLKSENSLYVVNNSLHCAIQPKRASIDIKLFLQLHRKLMRKKKIEKCFNTSLYQYPSESSPSHKGFKGSQKTSFRFYRSTTQRDDKTKTQANLPNKKDPFFIENSNKTVAYFQTQRNNKKITYSHAKPNMNTNFSLFKRNKGVLKNEHLCYKLIQNQNMKLKEQSRQNSSIHARHNKHKRNNTIA